SCTETTTMLIHTLIVTHHCGYSMISEDVAHGFAGLQRCGRGCRARWLNYLRPGLKHGNFTQAEESIICEMYSKRGSCWSVIAAQLPGRTDLAVKNYWNGTISKRPPLLQHDVGRHQAGGARAGRPRRGELHDRIVMLCRRLRGRLDPGRLTAARASAATAGGRRLERGERRGR
uniref:HTH myb-type domain-containing protein n=1 Tax=Aegilops tauschii subsp. strangulata TaxID=200361 RepID=A0A452YS32_AEGTS